jgi:HlyD family secretion protein
MKSFRLIPLALVSGLAACHAPSGDIQASGTIEATSVQVSARSTGQIVRLVGEEGMSVRQGDLLAEVDHSTLDLQLSQARSGVDLARAQLDLLVEGARAEDLVQGREQLNQANDALKSARDDFERMKSLFAGGAATKKQRDDAEVRFTMARAQANAADQALKKLENFARPEEVKAALARLDQARFSVKLLQKAIEDCTVEAPVEGVITEKLIEKGELAAPNTGLYVITDLARVRLTIYVPEPDLGRIRLGQEARVSVDSHPGATFPGRVTWISPVAEFTPRDIQTRDERVKLVFAVRIEIANPDFVFKPGMPADAEIPRARDPSGSANATEDRGRPNATEDRGRTAQ